MFRLMQHELDTINFYEKLIGEANDVELKKELLKYHSEFLKSLHALEKEFLTTDADLAKERERSSAEVAKARSSQRSK